MVALTTARSLGGRARQTQGGGTGQQLKALFSSIAPFIEYDKQRNDPYCAVY